MDDTVVPAPDPGQPHADDTRAVVVTSVKLSIWIENGEKEPGQPFSHAQVPRRLVVVHPRVFAAARTTRAAAHRTRRPHLSLLPPSFFSLPLSERRDGGAFRPCARQGGACSCCLHDPRRQTDPRRVHRCQGCRGECTGPGSFLIALRSHPPSRPSPRAPRAWRGDVVPSVERKEGTAATTSGVGHRFEGWGIGVLNLAGSSARPEDVFRLTSSRSSSRRPTQSSEVSIRRRPPNGASLHNVGTDQFAFRVGRRRFAREKKTRAKHATSP